MQPATPTAPYRQIGNALYIGQGEAVGAGIPTGTIKCAAFRRSTAWRIIEDPADRRRNLICMDTMRQRNWRAFVKVTRRYGDPFVRGVESPTGGRLPAVELAPADTAFFADQGLGDSKACKLARVCAWYRILTLPPSAAKAMGYPSLSALRQAAIQAMRNERLPHTPDVGKALERRLRQFRQRGPAAFLPGNKGRCPTLTQPIKRALVRWYAAPTKPSYSRVAKLYAAVREERQWPPLTERHIARFLDQPKIRALCTATRHGDRVARATMGYQITRRRASFPDAMWSFDGTRLPLAWQDESGKMRNDLYIMVVVDHHSEAIIGYRLGATETAELAMGAVKDALRFSGHTPHQLLYDNAAANKSAIMQNFMQRMTRVHFPCRPYNARAKRVERVIGGLQSKVMRQFPNFTGSNITAPSRNGKANTEYLLALKKQGRLPSLEDVIAQVNEAIAQWNERVNAAGDSPLQLYAVADDRRSQLTAEGLISLFMVRRKRPVVYRPDGLTVQIGKERLTYIVPDDDGVGDYDFRRFQLDKKFDVYADGDDLSMVYLYHPNTDKMVAAAYRKEKFAEAVVDRRPGEGKRLRQVWMKDDKFLAGLKQELAGVQKGAPREGIPELGPAGWSKDGWNRYEANRQADAIGDKAYQDYLFNNDDDD